MVGEVSISLATACYGTDMNGNNGHDDNDVLYIAFPGRDAVPGVKGALWTAAEYDAFEDSITALGDELIARIGNNSNHNGNNGSSSNCSQSGYCEVGGASRLQLGDPMLIALLMIIALIL
jgi:hypothetical protein